MRAPLLVLAFALASASCSRLSEDRPPSTAANEPDAVVLAPLHVDRFGPRGEDAEVRIVRGDDAAAESIATDLLAQSPPLAICFQARLEDHARPDGRATFTVRIGEDGAVTDVSARDVTTADTTFLTCLEEALRTAGFHALDRPRALVVPVDVSESVTSGSYP